MAPRPTPLDAARSLAELRHGDARVVLLAGSVVRGEATEHSDLDLVVVHTSLKHALRESLLHRDWPVEIFLHDPETLRYFYHEVDGPSGFPALPQMVAEGLLVRGDPAFAEVIQDEARRFLAAGPPPLSEGQIERLRYELGDLCDDCRSPRNVTELRASGARLYEALANAWFRLRKLWSARGKTIPRRMEREAPAEARRFQAAFERLWVEGAADEVLALSESLLAPHGGFCFEGYRLPAPESWRIEAPEANSEKQGPQQCSEKDE